MRTTAVVKLKKLIDKMKLENLTPEIDYSKIKIAHPEINRPALQLAGFFDHFSNDRVQIIGNVEYAYTASMCQDAKLHVYEEIFKRKIPCIVYARNLMPDEDVKALAVQYGVPLLSTGKTTSDLMAEVIRWLKVELAPTISIHGVLVDVFGEGVLIMGESGIGKSEAALELIKRGHRLVTDDVVEIRKVSDATLVGTAPDITRHMIELRGIGILDVKALFGAESVKNTQNIDMVINLEDWDKDKEYDRMGLDEQYTEFLGNKVVCHNIPIRPGRNLAVIVESAAVNYRQKKMGYNAAQELYNRVQRKLMQGQDEDDDE
ncbi:MULTISPECIES: HPr(Ser) kinase/phosphatase [unclassified Candidatus Paralachnospira]|uniref:HPr(Ser) kinase/phosphatase n=1 Tax=unclassified Candidatus Paralachnospira TaxID=3099471 RepID=UPI00306719E2